MTKRLLIFIAACLSAIPAFAAGLLHPIDHCALVDQRLTSPPTNLAVGADYTFSATLTDNTAQGGENVWCGVPSTATAILASVVAVNPAGPGYLKIWPAGGVEPPRATALNFFKVYDVSISNYPAAPGRLALIKLGTAGTDVGRFTVSTYFFGCQLIVHVEGWVD